MDSESNVLRELEAWFRAVLRKDKLEAYETRLFLAAAEWRKQLRGGVVPPPPKIPTIVPPPRRRPPPLPPPLPKHRHREMPTQGSGMRDILTITTPPIPRDTQEHLVDEMTHKSIPGRPEAPPDPPEISQLKKVR